MHERGTAEALAVVVGGRVAGALVANFEDEETQAEVLAESFLAGVGVPTIASVSQGCDERGSGKGGAASSKA